MAVYSTIKEKDLINFLDQYDIGALIKFEGILEGIENTNYKVITSKNKYIFTIFEKRVIDEELPFFIDLKKHLSNKNFLCPQPISNKKGHTINKINGKSCVIISYLDGKKINLASSNHCKQVGKFLSLLHNNTIDFNQKRNNSMGFAQWVKLFKKCQALPLNNYSDLMSDINDELIFLRSNWPKNLPLGIIHADVFKDNVFFKNNIFSGLIDFYFSCVDFYSYDVALTINAWCFDDQNIFIKKNFLSLLEGYESIRSLSKLEKKSLTLLLRGAAIRILITRLHDKLFHTEGDFVRPKDPIEYFKILKFHQSNYIKNYIV